VHAAAGLTKVMAVGSAKNQARGSQRLPAAALQSFCSCEKNQISNPRTCTFAGTHSIDGQLGNEILIRNTRAISWPKFTVTAPGGIFGQPLWMLSDSKGERGREGGQGGGGLSQKSRILPSVNL